MKLTITGPASGPRIDPVPECTERPLISVMIPVFNSASYLREALASVLIQDLGPEIMEIAVVDNCSTDDPETVVSDVGGGRVGFHRNATNIGAIENFNACIRLARGRWVHLLHADDLVRPGFYAHTRDAVTAHPQIGAFACRHVFTDEDGVWLSLSEPQARAPGVLDESFVERQLTAQRLHPVSLVVRRSAYEELGGFRTKFPHCTDWDMWNRLVLRWPIFYDPELLACNRLHPASATSHLIRTGENVREERYCVWVSSSYLPRDRARNLYRRGMQASAIRALHHVVAYWRKGDTRTAVRQFVEALRCWISWGTIGWFHP